MDALFIFLFLKMTSLNIPVWDSGPGLSQNGAGSVNFKGKIGCTLKPKVISSRSFYIEGRTVRTVFGAGVSNIWSGTFTDRGEKEWPWAPPGITEARSKAGGGESQGHLVGISESQHPGQTCPLGSLQALPETPDHLSEEQRTSHACTWLGNGPYQDGP